MLKKINKKLFLIVLGSIFIGIVIAVIGSTTISATTETSFCLKCHDAPEFEEFRSERPHGKIDCLDCHGKGFVQDKIGGVKHVLNTVTGRHDPNNYLDITTAVPSEKCLTCHNINNISRSESVITMHEGFVESETKCTQCHDKEFMHGDLGDYSNGSVDDATEGETPEETPEVEETAALPEDLYSQKCAACHGAELEGAVYSGSIAGFAFEDVLDKLQDGHGGLEGEDVEGVAEWVAAQ